MSSSALPQPEARKWRVIIFVIVIGLLALLALFGGVRDRDAHMVRYQTGKLSPPAQTVLIKAAIRSINESATEPNKHR